MKRNILLTILVLLTTLPTKAQSQCTITHFDEFNGMAQWYNTMNADGTPLDLSKRINRYYRLDEKGDTIWCTAKNALSAQEAAQYTIKAVMEGDDHWNPQLLFDTANHPIGYITINRKKIPVNQYGCFERKNKQ